jgi:monovalent cation:proton antiporter-2 (CPA2) family protein
VSLESFLREAVVYLAAAVISVPLAKRLGLGSVLGYLLAGILIGPFVLGLVGQDVTDVMHFAEFGVVMMLFVIGLELEPALLWKLRAPILGLGGLQVLLSTGAIAAGGMALDLPWNQALAVGMTLALSSTAIVLQTLGEKGQLETSGGRSAFSVLLFQDIAVIPMLALLPLLALGGTGDAHAGETHAAATTWTASLPSWGRGLVVLGVVAGIIVAGRTVLPPILRILGRTRSREIFTAAALLLVIGTALLMTQVGLSPALGTFLAGVVLANSEYRHELESDVEPFKGLLLGLFFISVGASLDFGAVASAPGTVFGITGGVLLLKFVVLLGLARAFGLGTDQAILFALALPQMGEFAFVLLSFAGQEGVLGPAVTSPVTAAVALSMAVTPLLLLLNDRVVQPRIGTRREQERPADAIEGRAPVLIAGFGAFGATVGRLLTGRGIKTTVLDFDSDRVELLRQLGLEVYYGDATRADLLEVAGAAEARLLVVALPDPDTTLELVRTARKHFPGLTVLARAFDWPDAHRLMAEGVEHVYRDTLDTSLRAGRDALTLLGSRAYAAHRATQTFRRHDEESMRKLYEMRDDRPGFLSAARERIQELERMLRLDLEAPTESRDSGWDPESLREEYGGGEAGTD